MSTGAPPQAPPDQLLPDAAGVAPDDSSPLVPPGRRLPRPLAEFAHTEVAGGVAILAAAVVALVWANSPFSGSYERLWETELVLSLGGTEIAEDLRHWVNDLLMAFFFFVAGLEIKRELVAGDLRDPRSAALPAIAALGGMVVPAGIYLAIAGGGPGGGGWGIPMATDIAFAVGVVTLLGKRVPGPLKLFLLTLAIVDDIGAIIVIAAFYSSGVEGTALAAAAGLLLATYLLRRVGVVWMPAYVLLAGGVWFATFESGIHATIAGVALGLLTPATPRLSGIRPDRWVRGVRPDVEGARQANLIARATVSDAERLGHALHPWTSFVVVPLFALANAGVALSADAFDGSGAATVALGVGVGLVVGKLVGVSLFTWLAVKVGLGILPPGVRWSQVGGVAAIAGVGFTVSLFVAGLAFEEGDGLEPAAKVGILGASLVAALLGSAVMAVLHRREAAAEVEGTGAPLRTTG